MKKILLYILCGVVVLFVAFLLYAIISWNVFNRPTIMTGSSLCINGEDRGVYAALFGLDCNCCGAFPLK